MSLDDFAWRLCFDRQELDERELKNKSFFIHESGMQFLDDHYGPRPGCIHVLLGSTGKGKSTLIHSLVTKWGEKDKILLYLSEESFEQVESKLARKGEDMSYLTPKLHLVHERTLQATASSTDYRAFLAFLKKHIEQNEPKILIIDNLTTSIFYENQIQNSLKIVSGLRAIAEEYQIPVFIVAHTKKGVNESTKGLITSDDVRGSSSLAMTADYFYIFHRVRKTMHSGSHIDTACVYVAKSRHHANQDCVYRLNWSGERVMYFSDQIVNFDIFKKLMKERDKA